MNKGRSAQPPAAAVKGDPGPSVSRGGHSCTGVGPVLSHDVVTRTPSKGTGVGQDVFKGCRAVYFHLTQFDLFPCAFFGIYFCSYKEQKMFYLAGSRKDYGNIQRKFPEVGYISVSSYQKCTIIKSLPRTLMVLKVSVMLFFICRFVLVSTTLLFIYFQFASAINTCALNSVVCQVGPV